MEEMDKKQAIANHFSGDYTEFFRQYVQLPNGSKDSVKVACPFHKDIKTLSLSLALTGDRAGSWKCFGCGLSGDVYTFYAKKHDLDTRTQFPQVLDGIIEAFGISVSQDEKQRGRDAAPTRTRGKKRKTSEERVETAHKALWSSPLIGDLKERRGLADETMQRFKLGIEKDKLIFPVYNQSGQVESMKIHKGPQTKGSHAQLYPWGALKASEIWICEGEPDVWRCTQEGLAAITGTAGAGTWKAEWSELFRDKDVTICFDADSAGLEGRKAIVEALRGIARRISYVDWPDGLADGYDLMDWLQDGHTLAELPLVEVKDARVSLEDVRETFTEWLYFEEGEEIILEVVVSAIVANRYDGEPVWLFLVAPPGGSKTEILRSLGDVPEVYMLSKLSSGTLISGLNVRSGTEDPSLLPKLNGKVLVIKDFTGILDMRREARQEVMGQLRDAFDGEASAVFGSGVGRRAYQSKFGLLAGVTGAIDKFHSVNAELGERFLRLRIPATDRRERTRRSQSNREAKAKMRRELREVMVGFFRTYTDRDSSRVEIGDEWLERLVGLADIVAILRTPVSRDGYTRDVDFLPEPEIPTRLVGQLTSLGAALTGIREQATFGQEEYDILVRVAADTIPMTRMRFLRELWTDRTLRTVAEIAGDLDLPRTTTSRTLEDLQMLNVVSPTQDHWKLTADFVERAEAVGFFGAPF